MIGQRTPGFVAGSDTSQAAAEAIKERAPGIARRVFDLVSTAAPVQLCALAPTTHGVGGLTCLEIEKLLGSLHETISARLNELMSSGVVRDSGLRRMANGSEASVYEPTGRPFSDHLLWVAGMRASKNLRKRQANLVRAAITFKKAMTERSKTGNSPTDEALEALCRAAMEM